MNPRRHLPVLAEEAMQVRRIYCSHYSFCLNVAVARNWPGFTCAACFDYAPINAEINEADLEGMAKMYRHRHVDDE